MTKLCDHCSVGVLITDERMRLLLLERALPPVGIAPPAGHIDQHGVAFDAALAEVWEEVGVRITDDMGMREATREHRGNICRRPPTHSRHDGHVWTVYQVQIPSSTPIVRSERETKHADWYRLSLVQMLVDRTVAYARGQVSEESWLTAPGIEPVWVRFLVDAGLANPLNLHELMLVENLACTAPDDSP